MQIADYLADKICCVFLVRIQKNKIIIVLSRQKIDIKPSEVKEDCFDYYYKGASFPWSTDNLAFNLTVFSDTCNYVTAPVLEMQKIEKIRS